MSEDAVQALRRDINYFVCTLGQAAVLNVVDPPPRLTLHEHLDEQAARIPDAPAVGFALPPMNKASDGPWTAEILSAFLHLLDIQHAENDKATVNFDRLALNPRKRCRTHCYPRRRQTLSNIYLIAIQKLWRCSTRVLRSFYSCGSVSLDSALPHCR